jgi:EPS-associated MarR family transcriptional regulator
MKYIEENLKILQYLQENPQATQREIGNELGISLGKVNFLIKALADKGVIKLERFKNSRKKIGYLYLVTPKGLAIKAQATRMFLKKKTEEYEGLHHEIEMLRDQVHHEELSGSQGRER